MQLHEEIGFMNDERQKTGDLYSLCKQQNHITPEGKYEGKYTFPSFTITTIKSAIGSPIEQLVFSSNRQKLDITDEFVPKGFTLDVSPYPFGFVTQYGLQIAKPTTLGRVVSMFHESAHAWRRSQFTPEEAGHHDEVHRRLNSQQATEDDLKYITTEERMCWAKALTDIKQLENRLGVVIISTIPERELLDYINRRETTYKQPEK